MNWQTTRFTLALDRPLVMGIVNVTPDSFSDGGGHADALSAIQHCERLVEEGADLLDIGGESTRPGAPTLPPDEEWARIEDVLKAALDLGVPVSVDTCKTDVMRRALDLGADVVNDVQALQSPGALELLAVHGRAGVCLMHMRGTPATMQMLTEYDDVTADVATFLSRRLAAAEAAGIAGERIALDPGYGFAKQSVHNLELLARQRELGALGRPLLVGWSRKRTLGDVTGRGVGERMPASVAAALMAVERGAAIVRVHDVAPTVDALKLWGAVRGQERD